MASLFHSFIFAFLLTIFAHISSALELVEIRPGGNLGPKTRLRPRDNSFLDLRSAETFLWGADSKLFLVLQTFNYMALLIPSQRLVRLWQTSPSTPRKTTKMSFPWKNLTGCFFLATLLRRAWSCNSKTTKVSRMHNESGIGSMVPTIIPS